MATRKEFVSAVTEQVMANPRAAVAGNGINAAVLKSMAERPDVIGKLATILWSTMYFKKGAKGLKRAANFQIKGYRNFNELNRSGRIDVENFMGELNPEDAAKFSNEENVVCILALPDSAGAGELSVDAQIGTGKSVSLPFMKAVKAEFKIPGGFYIVVMIGDSAARPIEEKKAAVKENLNKKKSEKRNPARVKAELTRKAKVRLDRIKAERQKLQARAASTQLQFNQVTDFAKDLGIDVNDPLEAVRRFKDFDKINKANLRSLSPEEKELYRDAVGYAKKGNVKLMKAVLDEIDNPLIAQLVSGGNITSVDMAKKTRLKNYRAELRTINATNEDLLAKIAEAKAVGNSNALKGLTRRLNANVAKANDIKVRMRALDTLTPTSIRDKRKMMAETNLRIESALAKGASITAALNGALAKLADVTTSSERQQMKEDIIQQMATNTPAQLAVQQAIQNLPAQQIAQDDLSAWDELHGDIPLKQLVGNSKIADILAGII